MRSQGCNILLLVNNTPSHIFSKDSLTNITLEFLEPNMTLHIQPMDTGIIQTFKAHYRHLYIMQALEHDKEDYQEIYHINQLEAMLMLQEAWSSMTATMIANCWRHSGILSTDESTHLVSTHSTNPTAITSTILQPAGVFFGCPGSWSHSIATEYDGCLVQEQTQCWGAAIYWRGEDNQGGMDGWGHCWTNEDQCDWGRWWCCWGDRWTQWGRGSSSFAPSRLLCNFWTASTLQHLTGSIRLKNPFPYYDVLSVRNTQLCSLRAILHSSLHHLPHISANHLCIRWYWLLRWKRMAFLPKKTCM